MCFSFCLRLWFDNEANNGNIVIFQIQWGRAAALKNFSNHFTFIDDDALHIFLHIFLLIPLNKG